MKSFISDRANAVKPSPTLAMSDMATKMKQQGINVISLSAGEPDFDTPTHACDAAKDAIDKGYTKYTEVNGIKSLREAVISKMERENNIKYDLNQVLISCGGKHSIFNLIMAVINPGDEVIIPAPYWVSYPDMVFIAGGSPVIIESKAPGFKISAQQLESAITDKTKLLFINSPSNPSGMMYSAEELKSLGEVLKKYPNILIASDDIYEHIIWPGKKFNNILNLCPELYDRTIILNGVAKAYAMTGWRIGYATGHPDIIKTMKKIQSQSTSNPTSIAQYAAIAALNGSKKSIETMVDDFKQRHDYIISEINKIHGMKAYPNDGTFYAFIDVKQLVSETQGIDDDIKLSEYILDKGHVSTVAGSSFGMEGYIRLSYASSMSNLKEAVSRLKNLFGTK